jgi:molybdopterin molybdotransferase
LITVAEASSITQQFLFRPSRERVKIEQSEGRVLAEAIKADRDFPPFDRVAMDGIAIPFRSFEEGWRDFRVEGMQTAGQPRISLKDPHNCIEVMTGSMMPVGCDAVIRYEDIQIRDKIAHVKIEDVQKWQSTHMRGHDAKKNDVLLRPGVTIRAAEVAILATVGRAEVEVLGFPTVAIISTGNELVDLHDIPQAHQIRRSNSYMLQAALHSMGCRSSLFHVPDSRNPLEKALIKILADHQVIISTGGVSKGKLDLIPETLEFLAIKKQFHEVSQRPGKPLWFGTGKKHIVFALPGNPVSTFLCFYRYIKPWFLKSMGVEPQVEYARLDKDFTFTPPLTYFLQAKVSNINGTLVATPLEGGGSGDMANLKEVDGFLELPADKSLFKEGDVFPYIPFR